jgi:hypothetical protein
MVRQFLFTLDVSRLDYWRLPMNFLVTGGAGFISSHVCERRLRGQRDFPLPASGKEFI